MTKKNKKMKTILISFLMSIIGINAATLTLGSKLFATAKTSVPMQGKSVFKARTNIGFVKKVGGIAFDAIAKPADDLIIVDISYDKNKEDGKRLILSYKNNEGKLQQIAANIYDWELVPIARFSNTEDISCFTLFGDLDKTVEKELQSLFGKAIYNYHPSFKNTLMGLRLFQADILFSQDAVDLPKLDGNYLLGAGEKQPSIKQNEKNRMAVTDFIFDIKPKRGSYLICNDDNVVFSIVNNKLIFKGEVHWQFWGIKEIFVEDPVTKERKLVSKVDKDDEKNKLISSKIKERDGINPAVYSALDKTLKYSALLRYFKKTDLAGHTKLMKSLPQRESLKPVVETPALDLNELRPWKMRRALHKIKELEKNDNDKIKAEVLRELKKIAQTVIDNEKK